jgi:uncharacterized protein YutE (UPF0331/DUF86 family)
MIDRGVVLRKLASLNEHAARLERRRPATPETLAADIELQDALSMSLLVSVQAALDIALHISSAEELGVPATYAEGFRTLADRGVIDPATSRHLIGMATLRHRLTHDSASVDFARTWAELPLGIQALRSCHDSVLRRIGDGPAPPPPTATP